MIKLVITFYRRPGMTLEQFTDRWLNVHGPLVRRLADDLHIRRYVQSHGLSADGAEEPIGERASALPPDACVELWYDNMADFVAALNTPEGRAATALLMQDEAEFVDTSRSVAWFTEEHEIVPLP